MINRLIKIYEIKLLFNVFIIPYEFNRNLTKIFFLFRNTICNRMQGSSEGILYPPSLDKRTIFRIIRKAFCRPLPIAFEKEVWTDNGIPGYLFTLMDNFADLPDQNPDNECFCRKLKTCMKKGLSNTTPCYYSTYSTLN